MRYVCSECGYSTPSWMGRCPQCGGWNTFFEEKEVKKKPERQSRSRVAPVALTELSETCARGYTRFSTGFSEVDRVLGGGIVTGSLILLSGDPGIGKSTLLLEIVRNVASSGKRVLYVSSEESLSQVYLRVERLKIGKIPTLFLLATGTFEDVLEALDTLSPELAVVDSIQNLSREESDFLPGGVALLRDLSAQFMGIAKRRNVALILVGHVTKEGIVAGPRTLEHLVDVVLYLEGDANRPLRVLRGMKNRFGSTQEIGLLELTEEGFVEVSDPSRYFLLDGESAPRTGVARTVLAEGKRAMVVEIQSLVHPSFLDFPRRVSLGVDLNRVHLLLAVIEKMARVRFSRQDVYVSIAGGIRTEETSLDLALCVSLVSSRLEKEVRKDTIFCGEVGLGGEIRSVPFLESRLQEALRVGIRRAVLARGQKVPPRLSGMECAFYGNILELFQ
ncbi:MAG: DNA repair protein RadA, partial [Candidatus Caldatribacterium sp.]|nr:DNA repair protein RadA [Candidatus Caldatribacterium sp.]